MPKWAKNIVRGLKGVHMFVAFFLFGFAIFLVVVVVSPVFLLMRAVGKEPTQTMHFLSRWMFSAWLWFLRIGGLIAWLPSEGKMHAGPCVVVANHPGLFDILFMVREIKRLSMIVKRSLARSAGLGPIFSFSRYVPSAKPGDAQGGIACADQVVALLRESYRVVIFPEGTRSPKGGLHKFNAGAFSIAQRAQVPVQPILIVHQPPLLPHEDKWYFPPYEICRFRMVYLDCVHPGTDRGPRAVAKEVQMKYSQLLNLENGGRGNA